MFNLHAKGGQRHNEQSALGGVGNRRSEADTYLQQFKAVRKKNKIKSPLLKQMFLRLENRSKNIPTSGNLSGSKNCRIKLNKDNRSEMQKGHLGGKPTVNGLAGKGNF